MRVQNIFILSPARRVVCRCASDACNDPGPCRNGPQTFSRVARISTVQVWTLGRWDGAKSKENELIFCVNFNNFPRASALVLSVKRIKRCKSCASLSCLRILFFSGRASRVLLCRFRCGRTPPPPLQIHSAFQITTPTTTVIFRGTVTPLVLWFEGHTELTSPARPLR